MNDEKNTAVPAAGETIGDGSDIRYVGFCDILGFSNRILTDFDGTLKIYKQFGDLRRFVAKRLDLHFPFIRAQVTMYSDAVLITGESLVNVLCEVHTWCVTALMCDLMLRGAITKGRYWEQREGNHLFVASDALVRAVKLERSIGVPAVFIADDVEIPDELWLLRFLKGLLATPVLHFRDRNIVNPFGNFWFRSAAVRASQLMADSPSHRDKYLWFLALHKAISDGQELIPPDVLIRFVREGKLTKRTKDEDTGAVGGDPIL
jgi:hypothetical protein